MDQSDKIEQMNIDLATIQSVSNPFSNDASDIPPINVFRPDDIPNEKKDQIRRHRLWMDTIQKEYPMPTTPYRIGIYIRYYNQTKHQDYLNYHKKQFQDTIALCPLWTLVDFYVDNGLLAPNMESSPEWCRLLDDCFSGNINLIITQKVSNVTRKPADITLISSLLASQPNPIGIYFISENIFTLASYYQHDMHESLSLTKNNPESLLSGGPHGLSDDE